MKKIILLSTITSSLIMAGGYKVPEQSINSMALGAAYIAHTQGADTAYFNPANMAFLKDKQFMEASITLAHLPRNKFKGDNAATSGESEIENLLLPSLHYVSTPIADLRLGASLTVPGGLTKRWESAIQKSFAQEFSLKVIEINPVMSYKISNNFAVGGGLRFIYSEGIIKNDARAAGKPVQRKMQGKTIEYGYNLAMTYKPVPDINMAMTYRSNINLGEEGEANLYLGDRGKQFSANVTVPLPAALNIAISKTIEDKYTFELVYERTYWSKYKTLDFNYGSAIQPALVPAFDDPKVRNWKDTNTYRLGLTAKVSNNITLMTAIAKDETPVPLKHVGYELPDSNAMVYSIGARVQANENLSYGIAYLHDKKEELTVRQGNSESQINGIFSEGGANLLTLGIAYTF